MVGRLDGRKDVVSALLCVSSPTMAERPPVTSAAGPVRPGRVVSLYSPTLTGFTLKVCWKPPTAGTLGSTPKPGPTNCCSIGERFGC
jgi:hypothetical protein